MRIAHVTATFPPYHGGTGNVCFHNARELVRRGHDVHVLTARAPASPRFERVDGISVHRLRPLVRVGNAPVLPGLVGALRGFDVVHLHYPFIGGELTTIATRLARTPLVITYHQDVLLSGAMGLVERALRHTTGRMTLRSAERVLFTTLDYGHASYAYRMLNGRHSRIDELPNGVDTETFSPGRSADALRARLALTGSQRVALLVAGLDRAHYFKGVEVFLRSLALQPDSIVGVIVGDGDLRPQYAALARELGIADRVRFAGRVSNDDLPGYYRLADVTVLPSTTMGEAFGLVLIESMASGTPVVATKLPGVRTVVSGGDDGLLVDPGDVSGLASAVGRILNDESLRRALGERGRAKAEDRYAWTRIGDRLEAIYLQLRAERTTGRFSVVPDQP